MSFLTDFQRNKLLRDLQKSLSSIERKRIQIMLMADQGKPQKQICAELKCSSATASRWIQMAQLGQAHHWQEKQPGRPPIATQDYRDRLQELVQMNPQDLGLKSTTWKAITLRQQLYRETGIKVSTRHINRLLSQMNLSTNSQSPQNIDDSSNQTPENSVIKIVIQDLRQASQ